MNIVDLILSNLFSIPYGGEILLRTGEHLILVAIAMTIAISIGIPLGIVITRKPKLAKVVLGLANAIQTIPSLAIFGFLISVPFIGGIGKVPAIVALSLYALLPLIRNTYTGIINIDPTIREAGRGMGMTDTQLLFQVEIPLALGIIIAGIRIATVISVGIATIAAAIGGGGLGVFIFRGISTVNTQLILAGAIPSAFIALGADLFLGWLERYLTQPGQSKQKYFLLGVLAVLMTGLLLGIFGLQNPQTETITIGSKNFTEQVILGEILAQQIEAKTDLKVERQFNLGGTFICHEAVKVGQIDGYVEYTGTALTAILKQKPITDPKKVYRIVKQAYDEDFQLTVMNSLGFENTFAIVIRREDAQNLNIKTLSQAAQYTPQWRAGFGYEFLARKDGYPGLAKTYGLKFKNTPQQMDLGLMYKALAQKQVDLVAGNSTDGLIPVLKLVVLEDDKKYFPPYEAVPVFNQETLAKYREIEPALANLAGFITAEQMQQMNYEVDNQLRPVAEVVKEFFTKNPN
ncbi:MAG: glycine betaine ABC transporter substrate-binding protein [Xenococcaceae cyanobacterium MO_188.B19]|nr:glycine betaine ABC transporter substrate-binding protein [Xenococcaceae cyanobacterium MO_188.B19]